MDLGFTSLKICDEWLPVVYKPFKKAKRLRLRYHKEGKSILVTGPWKIAPDKVLSFLNRSVKWLITHRPHPSSLKRFMPDSTFPYLGRYLTLLHHESKIFKVTEKEDILQIECPGEQFENIVIEWIKEQMNLYVQDICCAYGRSASLIPKKIRIGSAHSRWGSCSSKGHLNFSWRLALAPKSVSFYVVIHELCHLQEMNHSAAFWHLVHSLCPDYVQARLWLKNNGSPLNLWAPSL